MKDNKIIHLWKGINWLPEKYRNLTDKFILVVNDVQNAIILALNNKVVFLTADEKCSNQYKNMIIGNEAFGKDDVLEVIDEWKIDKLENILDKYDMFDIAVMNPPYDKNLHLKILETVIPHAEKVVNISPIRWLQDPAAKYKKRSDLNTFADTICKHIISVEKLENSNDVFGISTVPLGIYVCELNKTDSTVAENFVKNENPVMFNIWTKVHNTATNVLTDCIHSGEFEAYSVPLATVRGHGSGKNYDIVSLIHSEPYATANDFLKKSFRKKDVGIKTDVGGQAFIKFDTIEAGRNFINSTRTTFYHAINHFLKRDVHVPLQFLPYMDDYSQPWTNERFYEFFKLTPEEIETIEKYVQ